jgi:transcriptional regulator with XRE-family HTH domain
VSTPEKRRLEFGDRLRELRERAGYTGKQFAAEVGWHPSKVSKIETGKQLASDSDVLTWVRTFGALESTATELRSELREVRLAFASWKRQLRMGHQQAQQESQDTERAANTIRVFELIVVPGLVQTAEYARHVFATSATLQQTPQDTDAAVQVRLERQHALYDSAKHVELLMTESALRYFVCPPETMIAQVDRLLALCGLSTVRLGIIPLNARLPHVPACGFWIVDGNVFVEIVNTEVDTNDPDDVDLFDRLLDKLWTVAAEGDEARRLLIQVSTDLSQQITRPTEETS